MAIVFALLSIGFSYAAPPPTQVQPVRTQVAQTPVAVAPAVQASPAVGVRKPASEAQKIDVDALKERYWRSNSSDFNVVQNRTYTKSGRLNIQINGGVVTHDPFLSTYNAGFQLGMNFTEYLGVHAMYWKAFEVSSPAVAALQDAQTKAGGSLYAPNVNQMQSLIGGEVSWGVLYGKLSLLGKAILHFDLFLLGGAGALSAQNGTSIAPWAGIAQQIYITHFVAFRADYRYLIYSETLIEQNNISNKGAALGTRTTMAPIFSLGFSFYLF